MAEEANWVGNLIFAIVQHYLGAILGYFGVLFVLIGSPSFFSDTLLSFGFFAPDAQAPAAEAFN